MEYKDLQKQLEILMSLGYNREEIIQIATTAPAIFKYTPEGIKSILSSIPVSEEELLDITNDTQLIADEAKNKRNR